MHFSWNLCNDGLNDCEKDGMCDHTVNYSQPRNTAEGLTCDTENNIFLIHKNKNGSIVMEYVIHVLQKIDLI